MLLIIALVIVMIGIIIGMNNHPALGFITAVTGVALVYLWEPVKKLFKKS